MTSELVIQNRTYDTWEKNTRKIIFGEDVLKIKHCSIITTVNN